MYKVHRPWGRLVRLELKPHPALARLWSGAAKPELSMRAALAPTAAPPAPWVGHNRGAYLVTPTPLIRYMSLYDRYATGHTEISFSVKFDKKNISYNIYKHNQSFC